MTTEVKRLPGTSVRLAENNMRLWDELSRQLGITKTAVLAMALRELAKKEGVPLPSEVSDDRA
jgi:antitoxin component of RelBE/YafQ-DinJ toxin-antitoxin module